MRLLAATKEQLEALDLEKGLARLSDYLDMTGVRPVPEQRINGYACFRRHQVKSSNARLARRKAKRENIPYERALAFLNEKKKGREARSKAPFVCLKSASTGQKFHLMIQRIPHESQPKKASQGAGFSTYGLSASHPVPLF
ncbi:MAG: type I-F CRISPR-associated endoribonuclease Cas6/Csy4 [Hyphomicrobiaceae bacterium]|nr:type I-F CRISPR-associated endoribonuclease Cas6/Csy4 [Hyphomicrobiaceae bacterium]